VSRPVEKILEEAFKQLRKALAVGPDPPLDELPRFGPDADLACVFVHVDSNMDHGWPPLRLLTAFFVCGASCHHVVAASRFISSMWSLTVSVGANGMAVARLSTMTCTISGTPTQ
jgi:hypothetical protein